MARRVCEGKNQVVWDCWLLWWARRRFTSSEQLCAAAEKHHFWNNGSSVLEKKWRRKNIFFFFFFPFLLWTHTHRAQAQAALQDRSSRREAGRKMGDGWERNGAEVSAPLIIANDFLWGPACLLWCLNATDGTQSEQGDCPSPGEKHKVVSRISFKHPPCFPPDAYVYICSFIYVALPIYLPSYIFPNNAKYHKEL